MNLIALTALIAVCGAAKLDRTYLPPASAKTAGGSPGSLQAPSTRNSFNNGLGGLPKGSYENDFQGVVVDAAAAGTRTSGVEASGLGAPRISYGSTNSKVGGAAFKTKPSAFAQPQETEDQFGSQAQFSSNQGGNQGSFQGQFSGNAGFQSESQGANQPQQQGPERPRAAIDREAGILRYENEVGPENYHFAFETDNGITAEENGVATNGVQAQGGFSYTGDDGQVYSVSYTADEGGYQPKGDHLPTPPPIPEEILKSLEKNARDEAAGLSDDGSYDAQKYNAGSDYSKSDGANGKFTHQSSNFGSEADATASGTFVSQSNQPFRRPGQRGQSGQKGQPGKFGQESTNSQNADDSDDTNQSSDFGANANDASGQSANTQSGTGFSGQFGQSGNRKTSANRGSGQFGADNQGQKNTIGSSTSAQGVNAQSGSSFSGQFGQSNRGESSVNGGLSSGQFSQSGSSTQGQANTFNSYSDSSAQSGSTQGNRFGNRNEYLPPNKPSQNGRPVNGRPNINRPQSRPQVSNSSPETAPQIDEDPIIDDAPASFVPLGQQDLQSESRPQGAYTSFGKPISSQNGFNSNQNKPTNGRRPSSNNNFGQAQSSENVNRFSKPNEYLPPDSTGNRRPGQNRPQANTGSQFNQQNFESFQTSPSRPQTSSAGSQSHSNFGSEAQPTFATQPQQTNGFQRPQASRPGQNGNRFPSQTQTQYGLSAQSSSSTFGANQPIKATSQPDTELTTPFESNNEDTPSPQSVGQTSSTFASSDSRPTNVRPGQSSFGNRFNGAQSSFSSQSSRPQGSTTRPFGRPSEFPSQSTSQYNQNSQFESQSQTTFGQNNDAQFASSTQRPSYTQPQGPDDSYYYNQPSKPFGAPQVSRFPSAPSNQFDRVTTQSPFSQNQFSSTFQQGESANVPSDQYQGSTKYPQPPTIAPIGATAQAQTQFDSQSQFGSQTSQGSTKYPRPPTVAPTSLQGQPQNNAVNGVTQASISSFPSQTPTQTSQFNSQNQFGSRPSQTSQFGQNQPSPGVSSFGNQPAQPSFGQQSISSFSRPESNNLQSQTQSFSQQPEREETKENEPEPSVPFQQYNGEIYEYNKPAQSLPPPDSTPASSAASFSQKVQAEGQFGAQPSRPQFGQTTVEDGQRPITPFGSQASATGSRPQFGSQSRPQFGQTQSTQQVPEDSKPYGALAQSLARPSQSGARPQFGAQPSRPFGQGQPASGNDEEPEDSQSGAPKQPPCCKTLPSFDRKPQGGQSQFGQNFSSSQTFNPEPSSSFAGQGEQFGGPRPAPSFDQQTGYHY